MAELTRFEAVVGRGWKRRLPGGRPLATPAVVDGRAFVGGGFGSHEFYAFNLSDGGLEWFYRTADDGPTAAAVVTWHMADGHVSATPLGTARQLRRGPLGSGALVLQGQR